MPPKISCWDNKDLLTDLAIAFYQTADAAGGLTSEKKDAIEAFLKTRGHETSWNAIRQHVQKLRKSRDLTGLNAPSTPGDKPTAKKTASSTGGRKRASTGKGKKLGKDEMDDDETFNKLLFKTEKTSDLEDSPSQPPAKRSRTSPIEEEDDNAAYEH